MSIVGVVLGAVAGRVAGRALTTILGPEASKDLHNATAPLITSNLAPDEVGESIILSAEQTRSLEQFLQSPVVANLLESWAIYAIVYVDKYAPDGTVDGVIDAFTSAAEEWCQGDRDSNWSSYSEVIWPMISNFVVELLGPLRRAIKSGLPQSEDGGHYYFREVLHRHAVGSQFLRGSNYVPQHVRHVASIVSSPIKMTELSDQVKDLAVAYKNRYSEIVMLQARDDPRLAIESMYVNRTLRLPWSSDEAVDAQSWLDFDRRSVRTVVVGDPGVGKSTLMYHTIFQSVDENPTARTPLLVHCRDYIATGRRSIVDYIVDNLANEYSIEVGREVLEDLLTLGCAYVIFDGIDEVMDTTLRRGVVRKIESFAVRFPFVSIIVTSRREGYSAAPLDPTVFAVAELDQFTPEQFHEYVDRWFASRRSPEHRKMAFIRESESLTDIRFNPLMLSLLCILYKANGWIPRNRRSVYEACADLMFERWDRIRGIAHPDDYVQFGKPLLYDLGHFYYRHQSAQGGIEDILLERLVAKFLHDQASIDPPHNVKRAKEFIEFCAGRAWLLSKTGTKNGRRLFAFTHRSFMEYFASEALVQRAESGEEVVDEIISAFHQNPNSIVPDLMAQAYGERKHRGIEEILRILTAMSIVGGLGDNFAALCLRLADSSPLSRSITDKLPGWLGNLWATTSPDNCRLSASAFFDLRTDLRYSFIRNSETVSLAADHPHANFVLLTLARWARVKLFRLPQFFESKLDNEFSSPIRDLARRCRNTEIVSPPIMHFRNYLDYVPDNPLRDPALATFLISYGHVKLDDPIRILGLNQVLAVRVFDAHLPGIAWEAVYKAAHSPTTSDAEESRKIVRLLASYIRDLTCTGRLANDLRYWRPSFVEMLEEDSQYWSFDPKTSDDEDLLTVLTWASIMAAMEVGADRSRFVHQTSGVIGVDSLRRITGLAPYSTGRLGDELEHELNAHQVQHPYVRRVVERWLFHD